MWPSLQLTANVSHPTVRSHQLEQECLATQRPLQKSPAPRDQGLTQLFDSAQLEFDDALFGHVGYAISNMARSFFLALTHGKFSRVPLNTPTRRYYQNINRYSAAFALASDFAMLTLGGELKKRELLSARLGDILSSMYLASTVLKHFENQGRRATDLPLVEWSVRTLMYRAQEALHAFLRNFPNRWVSRLLRLFIFPRGRTYSAPADEIGRKVVELVTTPPLIFKVLQHRRPRDNITFYGFRRRSGRQLRQRRIRNHSQTIQYVDSQLRRRW